MSVCYSIYRFYFETAIQFIGSICFVLNLTSLLVFLQPDIHNSFKGHMYKYLILKSIADCYFGLKNIIAPIFRCEEECFVNDFYAAKLISLIFYFYLGHVCEFLSMFAEVAANFDRYLTITQKFLLHNSRYFYRTLILGSLVFTFSLYSYTVIEQKIVFLRDNNVTMDGHYVLRYNRFHWSLTCRVLSLINLIVRDGVLVGLLLVVDILTVIKLRQTMNSKRVLFLNQQENGSMLSEGVVHATSLHKAEVAERNITIMVLINGFLHVLVHSLLLFYGSLWDRIVFHDCYKLVMKLLLDLSKSISFVIYFIFNKQFRRNFKRMIRSLTNVLRT